jgi:hypothetical protein
MEEGIQLVVASSASVRLRLIFDLCTRRVMRVTTFTTCRSLICRQNLLADDAGCICFLRSPGTPWRREHAEPCNRGPRYTVQVIATANILLLIISLCDISA